MDEHGQPKSANVHQNSVTFDTCVLDIMSDWSYDFRYPYITIPGVTLLVPYWMIMTITINLYGAT